MRLQQLFPALRFSFDLTTDKAFLLGLLTLSLCLNVWLGWRVNYSISQPPRSTITGRRLETLTLTAPSGEKTTFTFAAAERPTVLYIMSPQCVWCGRNSANVATLVKPIKDRYGFVAISLAPHEETAQFTKLTRPAYEVYTGIDHHTKQEYDLSATPQTVVIATDGTITKHWRGAYTERNGRDIQEFFDCKLPGLLPSSNQEAVSKAAVGVPE